MVAKFAYLNNGKCSWASREIRTKCYDMLVPWSNVTGHVISHQKFKTTCFVIYCTVNGCTVLYDITQCTRGRFFFSRFVKSDSYLTFSFISSARNVPKTNWRNKKLLLITKQIIFENYYLIVKNISIKQNAAELKVLYDFSQVIKSNRNLKLRQYVVHSVTIFCSKTNVLSLLTSRQRPQEGPVPVPNEIRDSIPSLLSLSTDAKTV